MNRPPQNTNIVWARVQIRGRAMLAPTISISFLKFFGSAEPFFQKRFCIPSPYKPEVE